LSGADNTARRFTESALAERRSSAIADFHSWWAERLHAGVFEVAPIPFAELDGWYFAPDGGNLVHKSGRFFEIGGMHVAADSGESWSQPIINQPEIGILGILVKEFDGVLHCLLQAKMEPGNINTLQLSPTVQATRSNYTRVHGGNEIRYLEYFRGPKRGRILVDVLQSEQGMWCWRKHNRNMVVEVTGDIPEHEDFRWLRLSQLWRLLSVTNLVNMNARTVLACLPLLRPPASSARAHSRFHEALYRSYDKGSDESRSLHSLTEIVSWFTEMKTRNEWRSNLITLDKVTRFSRSADAIADDDRDGFQIIARRVRAENREVTEWTQPLLAPRRQGLAVFLAREIMGVIHLLVRARPEPGLLDRVEMGPSVQLAPTGAAAAVIGPEPFYEYAAGADAARVRFDAVMSEEGGRFHHAQTRYQVIEVGDDVPMETPENYCWLTLDQIMELVRHGHYLTVEARSLLTCVHSLW
jgi:oxidase EvaA